MNLKPVFYTFTLVMTLSISHAATLEADYQLQGTLDSSVGGIPPLNYPIGTPNYVIDTVDGQSRQVLDVPPGSGPQAVLNGFVSSNNYSVVLLASFPLQAAVATKLMDFKDLTSDSGLYINNGLLDFYDETGSTIALGGQPLLTNGYGQIVITRDEATDLTSVYVNGAPAFSFTDTSDLAVVSNTNTTDNLLTFFTDDHAGLGAPEDTTGNIARIRLYDGVLTPEQVAALDRVEPVPEPTCLSLALAGGILATAIRSRMKRSRKEYATVKQQDYTLLS